MRRLFACILPFLILPLSCSACPASTPATFYIRDVVQSSDTIMFINTNMEVYGEEGFSKSPRMHAFLPMMSMDERHDWSRFNVTIVYGGRENLLYTGIGSRLKRVKYHYGSNSTYHYYEFPSRQANQRLMELSNNASLLAGSPLRIYVGDELAKEYVLGYEPAHVYRCGGYAFEYLRYAALAAIAVAVLGLALMIRLRKPQAGGGTPRH